MLGRLDPYLLFPDNPFKCSGFVGSHCSYYWALIDSSMFAKYFTLSFIFIFLGVVWHFYFLFYSRVRVVIPSSYYHPFNIIPEPEGPLRSHVIEKILGDFPFGLPKRKGSGDSGMFFSIPVSIFCHYGRSVLFLCNPITCHFFFIYIYFIYCRTVKLQSTIYFYNLKLCRKLILMNII